jgi:hypothetical protein
LNRPYIIIHQSRAGTAHPPVFNVPPMGEWAAERRTRRSWWQRLFQSA